MTSWPNSLIHASVILAISAPAAAQEVAPLNFAGRDAAPDHAGLARVEPAWPNSVFACGTTSTQFLAGAYFSGQPGPIVPIFDYLPVSARFGSMLTGPEDYWWGKGNFECLCDTTGAIIISDYGRWLAGQTYYLRYHFLDGGECLVPYHQLGFGWLLTDAYRVRTQEVHRTDVRVSGALRGRSQVLRDPEHVV